MHWLRSMLVAGGAGATVFGAGCGGDERLPTEMSAVVAASKPGEVLRVTPPQLNLPGPGAIATLSATTAAGPVSIEVSSPACVSVAIKSAKGTQFKFTVTAIAVGSCTLTVTDGGTGNAQVPVSVAAPVVPATLAAGSFHTCGLDASGAAWCWGKNDYGQLGNSANLGIITANPTQGAVGGGLTFAALTAGGHHTCGLTPAGIAYCWGSNESGQLGNSTNSGVSGATNSTPLPVGGNLTFTRLSAGEFHTCGITTQGVMYCWGFNYLGQLGTATNNNTSVPNPTPAPVDGSLTFVAVAAGSGHTCGIVAGGTVYCWGLNLNGQLGRADDLGALIPHPTPTAVPGLPSISSLAAGRFYTCGLSSAGAGWCWGDNSTGQLGATTIETSQPTPVAVSGGLSFIVLGAGSGHTCGLTSGGTAYCWGQNVAGQLGSTDNFGTSILSYSPTAVSGLSLSAMAIGTNHGCGLTTAGQGWCWGDNRYGQLGTSTNNNTGVGVPTAVAISGLTFAIP